MRLLITPLLLIFVVPLAPNSFAQESGSASAVKQDESKIDPVGEYTLISVDGKQLPAKVAKGDREIEVRSGVFTIKADGTCGTTTVFLAPNGKEINRKVKATYTQDANTLNMKWIGAGRTTGTINDDMFRMDNKGMIFSYKKQPATTPNLANVLDRFVGTWKSVQTISEGNEVTVQLKYDRVLGDQYVQEQSLIDGELVSTTMFTYDADKHCFRSWRFAKSDPPTESTGQWNAAANTLRWSVASASDVRPKMETVHRFIDDDHFEWEVTGIGPSESTTFQLKGTVTRSR